ncbi:MAG: aminotransferase class V-fold PLP-dependent enzyme, partial [Methanocorpusculum sp.]|nr:aminotransferase class V-fold PLP-dependent enzyme [Methanocorpusculum sp.]
LMVMTQASNVLGSVQQIEEIGKILHEHDIFFIVDGAQTAGHIPISLRRLPADAFAFTGHKGLFGIAGTGGFYLRDPDAVRPTRFGGTGTNSRSLFQPEEMPDRFECGTHNYPGLAALAAGVEFLERTGVQSVEEKALRQTGMILRELAEMENIRIYNSRPDVPIIAFNIDGLDNDDAGFLLARRHHILTRTGLHCAPLVHAAIDRGVDAVKRTPLAKHDRGAGCVRMSLSYFTTDEECRAAASAVKEIAEHAARNLHSA